jgi:hypothetical protein
LLRRWPRRACTRAITPISSDIADNGDRRAAVQAARGLMSASNTPVSYRDAERGA